MENLETESEQIKADFAHFGAAVFHAQGLERQVAIWIATEYKPHLYSLDRQERGESFDSLFSKTLGSLIMQVRNSVDVPIQVETELRKALQKRNWLAHHYFWERAPHFTTENGRDMMIKELSELQYMFEDLDRRLTLITDQWSRKNSLTEEMVMQCLNELLESAP